MKELFRYPKTKMYNASDLITNPNEIKNYLVYLQKPNSDEDVVRIYFVLIKL